MPVLVIHGANDSETPPAHSRRVFAALTAAKELVIVPRAGRNNALDENTWRHIDVWLDGVLSSRLSTPLLPLP